MQTRGLLPYIGIASGHFRHSKKYYTQRLVVSRQPLVVIRSRAKPCAGMRKTLHKREFKVI